MAREYCAEEKIAYVEEYKNSGLSIAQFAMEKKIPASTLSSWLRLNQAMTFGEIKVMYSIIESAKANKLNIYKYINYLLEQLPQLENPSDED